MLKSALGLLRRNISKMTNTERVCACNYLSYGILQKSTSKSFSLASSFDISLKDPLIKSYVEKLVAEYQWLNMTKMAVAETSENDFSDGERLNELRRIINVFSARQQLYANISSLEELIKSSDKELSSLAKEEIQLYEEKLEALESELLQLLIPKDQQDTCQEVLMEISAGVGGQEAMLFAKEIHEMYIAYADFKGWDLITVEETLSEVGGLRHSSLFVSGAEVFKYLKHEAGVHRVQRIPSTERSGRIHTSTVSVVVLPQPEEVEVRLKEKDLKIETKRASGAGGQHVNTTDSAVRITHIPTGITVECQIDRSQIKNRQHALQRLRAKLYQQQLDEHMAQANATRKQQVKSNLRSEKIRTYNFNQDRITDHRMSDNMYNLDNFLSGGELLDKLIQQLEFNSCKERLHKKISEIINL